MKKALILIIFSSVTILNAQTLPKEKYSTIKESCVLQSEHRDANQEQLKALLMEKVKRNSVEEIFGTTIKANTLIVNGRLISDKVKQKATGSVRIKGKATFYNGKNFGEVCTRVKTYITQEDFDKYQPKVVTIKHFCYNNPILTYKEKKINANYSAYKKAITKFKPQMKNISNETAESFIHGFHTKNEKIDSQTGVFCMDFKATIFPYELETAEIENFSSDKIVKHRMHPLVFSKPMVVLVKAGRYIKGSEEDFEYSPEHEVTIEKDFYVGRYEVSFDEFDIFAKETGWIKPSDNGWGRGKNPVINVSYTDAIAYTEWLSKKTRHHYRLITENEWEYIARAGTQSIYGFGDDKRRLELYVWYKKNSKNHPHIIGGKKANRFGVYDILGNVSEITDSSFYGYDTDEYLEGNNDSDTKVLRGGSFFSMYNELEVYKREEIDINRKSNSTGFRIVLEK